MKKDNLRCFLTAYHLQNQEEMTKRKVATIVTIRRLIVTTDLICCEEITAPEKPFE